MSRAPSRKGYAFYRVALMGRRDKGPDDFRGLRSYANGFDAENGYDLHRFDEWTPAQKAKITRYFNATMELASRAHKVIRPRNKKNLDIIQTASQHPEKLPLLKVAFLPVANARPVKIKVTKSGKVIVKGEHFSRELVNFNKRALVRDPDKEVARAVALSPNANLYKIQAGAFEVSRGAHDAGTITAEVKKLMAKYDGKTVIDPRKDPRHHHHKQWLNGLVAYTFPRKGDAMKVLNEMGIARQNHKLTRRRERHAINRELFEPLGEQEYIRLGGNRPGMIHWDDLSKTMQGYFINRAKARYKPMR